MKRPPPLQPPSTTNHCSRDPTGPAHACLASGLRASLRFEPVCPLLPGRTPNVRVAVTLLCRVSPDNSSTRYLARFLGGIHSPRVSHTSSHPHYRDGRVQTGPFVCRATSQLRLPSILSPSPIPRRATLPDLAPPRSRPSSSCVRVCVSPVLLLFGPVPPDCPLAVPPHLAGRHTPSPSLSPDGANRGLPASRLIAACIYLKLKLCMYVFHCFLLSYVTPALSTSRQSAGTEAVGGHDRGRRRVY